MLQALGVNNRRLDSTTRERRVMMFWHLNLLDKGLAVIFGRPPTFHRGMMRGISLLTPYQLRHQQPGAASVGEAGLFGIHYFHQKLLLAQIMTDIWDCLYEGLAPDENRVETTIDTLKSWYGQARKVGVTISQHKPHFD